jgi:uncharacterized protein
MPGTKAGSVKAVATIEKKFGKGYWARIGSRGGSAPCKKKNEWGKNLKGFAAMPEHLRIEYGTKGGRISRRATSKKVADLGYKQDNTDFWESE